MGLSTLLWGGISFDPATEIPLLKGKVILITGANSGLGKRAVLDLARYGEPAVIWLAARGGIERAQAAVDDIVKEVPAAVIKPLDLDIASFESIKAAARRVLAESDRLDILMNNAGIMATPPGLTTDGYEIQFGTNHVGHALLTKLLLPLLLKTAAEPDSDVRVVVLSSIAHKFPPKEGIQFDTLKSEQVPLGTARRYGQSKLANIFFASEMARRYPAIKTVSVHPGAVATNLTNPIVNTYPFLKPLSAVVLATVHVSIPEGVKGQLWAATSKDAVSGEYYVPLALAGHKTALAKDDELAGRLWEWTEKELEGQTI